MSLQHKMLLTVRKQPIMNHSYEKMIRKADNFLNNWAEQCHLLLGKHHGKNIHLYPHNQKNDC